MTADRNLTLRKTEDFMGFVIQESRAPTEKSLVSIAEYPTNQIT